MVKKIGNKWVAIGVGGKTVEGSESPLRSVAVMAETEAKTKFMDERIKKQQEKANA